MRCRLRFQRAGSGCVFGIIVLIFLVEKRQSIQNKKQNIELLVKQQISKMAWIYLKLSTRLKSFGAIWIRAIF